MVSILYDARHAAEIELSNRCRYEYTEAYLQGTSPRSAPGRVSRVPDVMDGGVVAHPNFGDGSYTDPILVHTHGSPGDA